MDYTNYIHLAKLKNIIDQIALNNTKKILVVGDIMLDRYWVGNVDRISPEAPVPIAKINHTDDRLGGAANVAKNITTLNGNASILSIIAPDEAGNTLMELLDQANINNYLQLDNTISTTIKLRVLAKNQQLIRIDFENTPSSTILNNILIEYNKIINNYDLIILSDYGKYCLQDVSELIKIANQYNKIITIDPKGTNYDKYSNATLITPNKKELFDAVGGFNSEEEMISKAMLLKNTLNLKYLLLTRSEEGMTLFTQDQIINYNTVAQEVYDVSGAGDTVIATLSLLMAHNVDINDAVMIANIAAGIVVTKIGTATTSLQEITQHIKTY